MKRISIKQLNKFGESSDIIISFENLFFNVCKYLKSSESGYLNVANGQWPEENQVSKVSVS